MVQFFMPHRVYPVLQWLHWLPVVFNIQYELCLLMYYIHTGQCPKYLREAVSFISKTQSRRGLRSTDNSQTWKWGQFLVSVRSVLRLTACNSLPSYLHCIDNTTMHFKRYPKTHLFALALYFKLFYLVFFLFILFSLLRIIKRY